MIYGIQYICHFPYKVDGKYNEAIYVDKTGISVALGSNSLIVRKLFDNECYFKYKHKKIINRGYRHCRIYYVDIDELNDKCSCDLMPQFKEKIQKNIRSISDEYEINSQTVDSMLEVRMAGRMNNINNSYETNISTLNDEYREEYKLLIEKKKFTDSIGQQGVPTKLNELTEYLKQSFITSSDNFVHNFLIKFDYTNTLFPILFIELYKTGFDDEFDELLRQVIELFMQNKNKEEFLFRMLIVFYSYLVNENDSKVGFFNSINALIIHALSLNDLDVLCEVLLKIFEMNNEFLINNHDYLWERMNNVFENIIEGSQFGPGTLSFYFEFIKILLNSDSNEKIIDYLSGENKFYKICEKINNNYCLFDIATALLDYDNQDQLIFEKSYNSIFSIFTNYISNFYSDRPSVKEEQILLNFFNAYIMKHDIGKMSEIPSFNLLNLLNDLTTIDLNTNIKIIQLIFYINDKVNGIFTKLGDEKELLNIFCDILCNINDYFHDDESHESNEFYTNCFKTFYDDNVNTILENRTKNLQANTNASISLQSTNP